MNFFRRFIWALTLGGLIFTLQVAAADQPPAATSTFPNGIELTLANGMKLFMLRNPKQPTVAVVTAVHAGSVDDPPQSTGLAHYFEHLMFKGSNRIGTVNYEKEHKLLNQIENLFEQQRKSSDPTERTEIYKKIDLLSQEAAAYAAPGEYSQLVNTLGGTGLNAMTSYTGTVYVCEVPANELGKILQLEAERFSQPVLRLFQTELETVYEEFNTAQDRDDRRAFEALLKGAYGPLHPYGRGVIGLPEHLKNPSMRDIYTFAKRYYVPANMQLIIIGDIDYQKTLEMVNKYFNHPIPESANEFNRRTIAPPPAIASTQKITVSGPAPAQLLLGYRFSATKRNELLCDMLELALNDSGSGILEENLLRNQQLQGAFATSIQTGDQILFVLGGRPKAGQNLTRVAELLKEQLKLMSQKPMEKWRLTAAADNFRLKQLNLRDSNLNNAVNAAFCFTDDKSYAEFIRRPDDLAGITPEELQNFVTDVVLKSPLIEVDKVQGAPDALTKIPKPPLTPIEINRNNQSEYARQFIAAPNDSELPPDFLADLKHLEHYEFSGDDLTRRDLLYPVSEISNQGELFYLRNLYDDRFTLEIVIDSGKLANPKLAVMAQFMEFVAPSGMSAVEFRRELYKRTLTLDFSCANYTSTLRVSGLNKYLPDAVDFVTKLLNTGYADTPTVDKFRDNILKQRADAKQTPAAIFSALLNYGIYGPENPMTLLMPENELRTISAAQLIECARKQFMQTRPIIFYYGPAPLVSVTDIIRPLLQTDYLPPETNRKLPVQTVTENETYTLNYPKAQASLAIIAGGSEFTPEQYPFSVIFDNYCGSGLSAMFFQEIREARGLAYSAYGFFDLPYFARQKYITGGILQTQSDKVPEAATLLHSLLLKAPESEKDFIIAKSLIQKDMRAKRVRGEAAFNELMLIRRLDLTLHWRQRLYEKILAYTLPEFTSEYAKYLGIRPYRTLIFGDMTSIDLKKLPASGFGSTPRRLTLEEIFGY